MKKFCLIILLLGFLSSHGYSQIQGHLKSLDGERLSGIPIILQKTDSTFIKAIVSNSDGLFHFKIETDNNYQLLIQSFNYKPLLLTISPEKYDLGDIILTEKVLEIDEVTVVAQRPIVRLEGSALSYDAASIIKKSAVSNAFEVIQEIPGILGADNKIELIGSGEPKIIINGKTNGLTKEQMYSLLKSISATAVQKVDVMYNAPSRYGTRGAVINILINKENENSFAGEIKAQYNNTYYGMGLLGGNILFTTKKLQLDVLTNYSNGKSREETDKSSLQTLKNDAVTTISQYNTRKNRFQQLNARIGLDYTFDNKNQIAFSYYNNLRENKRKTHSKDEYIDDDLTLIESKNKQNGNNNLHNFHMDYTAHSGLNIGVDYTKYLAPEDDYFISFQNDVVIDNFVNRSKQNIDQWKIFGSQPISISSKSKLDIGFRGGYNHSKTTINYLFPENGSYIEYLERRLSNKQKEYTGTLFIESSHRFNQKLFLLYGFEVEYFKSDYYHGGMMQTLWNQWTFYPKITFSYNVNERNAIQFNISSDKSYPSYWAVSPQTSYLDSYSIIEGNPALRPCRNYDAQLMYIFKQKYMLMIGISYMPDYFALIPHQEESQLKMIYRNENYDFTLFTNVSVIIPFNVGKVWSGRISLHGMRMQDKMNNYYGNSFNKEHYVGAIAFNNSIQISKIKPNIVLTINGRYQSKSIQGIYDLDETFSLASGLRLTLRNNSYFLLQYNNIFRKQNPRMTINFDNQHSIAKMKDFSTISLQFVYRFGKYRAKQLNSTDEARFKRDK